MFCFGSSSGTQTGLSDLVRLESANRIRSIGEHVVDQIDQIGDVDNSSRAIHVSRGHHWWLWSAEEHVVDEIHEVRDVDNRVSGRRRRTSEV